MPTASHSVTKIENFHDKNKKKARKTQNLFVKNNFTPHFQQLNPELVSQPASTTFQRISVTLYK
jgi:hypothetical protein